VRQDRPVSELEDQIARGFGLAPQVRDRVDLLMALWCEHDHGRPMLEADLGRLNLRYVQCRGERLTAIGRYGWVRLGAIRSPIDPVRLTNEGIELAETIARRRADYRQRRGAVRDAVLCWLDQPHDRTAATTLAMSAAAESSALWPLTLPYNSVVSLICSRNRLCRVSPRTPRIAPMTSVTASEGPTTF